jgi:hypothetical protein
MRPIFQALAQIATNEFKDIVVGTELLGGTPIDPNKLRLHLRDGSFLDIWLSADGDYSYHWEQRRQRGKLYRWDNAPHHPKIDTFPHHLHEGDENLVVASHLDSTPEIALRQVLEYVRSRMA